MMRQTLDEALAIENPDKEKIRGRFIVWPEMVRGYLVVMDGFGYRSLRARGKYLWMRLISQSFLYIQVLPICIGFEKGFLVAENEKG